MFERILRWIFIAALVLYWPFIFLMSHLSMIPGWLLRTEMSDKSIHYLGYLMLTFLWWYAFRIDTRRKRWFKILTLAVIAGYGAADEFLQSFVNRTPDVMDYFADLAGALTILTLAWVFRFRTVAMIVAGVIVIVMTNLAKFDPLSLVPVLDIAFYLAMYAGITVLWSRIVCDYLNPNAGAIFLSVLGPAILLAASFYVAFKTGRNIEFSRIAAASAGIIAGAVLYKALPSRFKAFHA